MPAPIWFRPELQAPHGRSPNRKNFLSDRRLDPEMLQYFARLARFSRPVRKLLPGKGSAELARLKIGQFRILIERDASPTTAWLFRHLRNFVWRLKFSVFSAKAYLR